MNRLLHILPVLLLLVLLHSCKVGRFFIYNFADIKDHKKFPARTLEGSSSPFVFTKLESPKAPKMVYFDSDSLPFGEFLDKKNTVAFLIIRRDTILYENYWRNYDETSIVPSFSMAKSMTSMLIGCAIEDGLIQSVDEPVTNYIPELKDNGFDKVTIEHVLQMTSGIDFNESYTNPFGDAATFYYGRNLRKAISKMTLKRAPGEQFEYTSGNTQLLGLILERALKDQTVTAYFQEKIWGRLGMEFDASWSIDRKKEGLEKTFCCVNARARDYAKLGRLYLHDGNWNGDQLVPAGWVAQSTKMDTSNGSAWYYQYQWWLPSKSGDFIAKGILGQYIYVDPAKDLIMVRMGRKSGSVYWERFFQNIAKGY